MPHHALIDAFKFDGTGRAMPLTWADIQTTLPQTTGNEYIWVHLDWMADGVRQWLGDVIGLDASIADALATRGTRPAVFFYDHGYSMNLRGVNLNAENDPADMISVRFWVASRLVITLRNQRLRAFDDIRDMITAANSPADPDEFVLTVAERLLFRVDNVVRDLEEEVDLIEDDQEDIPDHKTLPIRKRGSHIRNRLSRLRRHLAPQRDALLQYVEQKPNWPDKRHKRRARALTDRTVRLVEEFDSMRERTQIVNENMMAIESERMNRTMYWLTVIAGLFLPISFFTGLLGINVGGIPAADSPLGFAGVSAILAVIVVFEIWLFRKLRLI